MVVMTLMGVREVSLEFLYLADALDEPGAPDGVPEGRVPRDGGSDDEHVVVARHSLSSADDR